MRKRSRAGSKAKPRRSVRRKTAFDLRLQGLGYPEIGRQLGITRQGARKLVETELAALALEIRADAQEVRDLEVSRLDTLLAKLWPRTQRGDPEAIRTALRIAERRAKLLGLDAPVQHEVEIPGGLDVSGLDGETRRKRLDELLARRAAAQAAGVDGPGRGGAGGPPGGGAG